MTPRFASAILPLLRGVDAERAHGWALHGLRAGLAGTERVTDDPILATEALGLAFRNPIGLAAGFDKNAISVEPLLRLGFGCVEAGTATPRPQYGNPKPRLFRLAEDRAVINRMGMNNRGIAAFAARLAALRRRPGEVIGANIGINRNHADPPRDYPALYAAVAPFADYVVMNVSSPNTPGMRDLQGEAQLAAILEAMAGLRNELPRWPPLLVKIAPDLTPEAMAILVESCVRCGVQGLVVSNTMVTRPTKLRSRHWAEAGGLSGPPLFESSTAALRLAYRLARGRLTLIGCGGVGCGDTAYAKLRAGASLVQLYAAFAYEGPALIPRIKRELAALLRRDGFSHVADAVGADLEHA